MSVRARQGGGASRADAETPRRGEIGARFHDNFIPGLNFRLSASPRLRLLLTWFLILLGNVTASLAAGANLPVQSALPEVGFSVLRVLGSLILVLALFLGGVWLYKNWQRVALYKGQPPKLNILEVKSLGSRHALYLVAYEQQRLLISSSPAGINLLTHLPEAEEGTTTAPSPGFAQSLRQALAPK